MYILTHPVGLVFFFEKKKKRKTNLFTKYDKSVSFSFLFFFYFFYEII